MISKTNNMKKYLFLYILYLPYLLTAQISLGISAGINIGKFGGVEPPKATFVSRSGINFGGVIGYRIDDDISLTIQPTYSQRGSNIEVGEDNFFDSLQTCKAKINFVTIPVFVRIDADNGLTYFISGLEFGIPLSALLEHKEESIDIYDRINKIDILATIGMGFRFSIGKPDLLIELRYYQGLLNFISDEMDDKDAALLDSIKNSGFQIMAGVEWKL